MLGYDEYKRTYDRDRRNLPFDWERQLPYGRNQRGLLFDWRFGRAETPSLSLIRDSEHYAQLLQEAEWERLAMRLPQGAPWPDRAWTYIRKWFSGLECRLRSRLFQRPCGELVI